MLLRVGDKATDISDKSIVLVMSVHRDYIEKTTILDCAETQKRYMLANIFLMVAKEWFLGCRGCRVIFSIIFPLEEVSDGSVLAVVGEIPLVVTKHLRFVNTKIAASYHRRVVWIRVMVEVAEIAEDCALLGEDFQQIVFDGGLVVLVFEYDDKHVVEVLWRSRLMGASGGVLGKAENRDGPKSKGVKHNRAARDRHVSSKTQVPWYLEA